MLPEYPAPRDAGLLQLIIVRYPQWIIIKCASQVLNIEVNIGIDDRLYVVIILNRLEPSPHFTLQLRFGGTVPLLYIQHRRQITRLEVHLFNKMLGLCLPVFCSNEEMISTPDDI